MTVCFEQLEYTAQHQLARRAERRQTDSTSLVEPESAIDWARRLLWSVAYHPEPV